MQKGWNSLDRGNEHKITVNEGKIPEFQENLKVSLTMEG